MTYDKLAILDVETTGATAYYDRIMEIGVLRIEKGKVVKKFETFINPEVGIPPFIEGLTGIGSADLENAPLFSDIKNDLIELLEGCTFVAHNARFDYSFIKNEFKRIGIPYSAKQLCTVKLSRLLFPNFSHHNLDSIIERFEISCERRHRAFDDAKVLWDFLQKIQAGIPPQNLEKAFKTILKKPSLPPLLKNEDVDSLPEKTGVYMFFGKSEIPLYIGKSINIKERVLSHFLNDTESSTEMEISQQVERIETFLTPGELSALLLESTLIKKLQPIYNRKLRYARKLTFLRKKINEEGYFTLDLRHGEEIAANEIEEVLGIFKSKKAAKEHLSHLVKEHSLCENLLGLQKTVKPCFSYRLGWCKGACAKKENASLYNARFTIAFSKTKLKAWPFNGPILIRERNEELEDGLIFDKWCYLGKYSEFTGEESKDIIAISDFDIYKILNSFLKEERNLKRITTLSSLRDKEFLQQWN
jgi:DNA polymerase-3 subunit epsilon